MNIRKRHLHWFSNLGKVIIHGCFSLQVTLPFPFVLIVRATCHLLGRPRVPRKPYKKYRSCSIKKLQAVMSPDEVANSEAKTRKTFKDHPVQPALIYWSVTWEVVSCPSKSGKSCCSASVPFLKSINVPLTILRNPFQIYGFSICKIPYVHKKINEDWFIYQ